MKDEVNNGDEGQHRKSRTQARDRCFNGCTHETEFHSNSGSCTLNKKGSKENSKGQQ